MKLERKTDRGKRHKLNSEKWCKIKRDRGKERGLEKYFKKSEAEKDII